MQLHDAVAGLSPVPMSAEQAALAATRALRNPQPVDTAMSVVARVLDVAEADPDRVAVSASTVTVSYAGLAERVRQIRAVLVARECGVQDRIAVVGRRSPDTIAAFLAIESVGAAYLPVDPDWPTARVAGMFGTARPRCLLADDEHATGAGPAVSAALATRTPVVALSEVGVQLLPDPTRPAAPAGARSWIPSRTAAPDEPRYIIHTSGSSGRPKGTVVEQRGLLNHLWSMVATLRLTASDTVAFSAPPAYVVSVWQMLAVLLVGGSVAVVDDADLRFGRRTVSHVARAGVTVVELVPTMIGWIVTDLRKRRTALDLARLRCLISTGEKLDPALAAEVAELLPHAAFYNAYGATECSDDVSLHRIGAQGLERTRVPAGRPLPNVVLYLLVSEDQRWRAAEPGEVGELWVGGAGVAGGYLGEPDLTRVSFFVDDIDPGSPTGRLYRTRDLAVFSDGLVHCLGRVDRQVKIAGNRIELDEVEAAVNRLCGVRRCAVLPEGEDGRAGLVVYYEADPGVRQEELYAPLRAVLPPAMFPRRWVRMDSVPVNANGKTDYRALGEAYPGSDSEPCLSSMDGGGTGPHPDTAGATKVGPCAPGDI